MGKYKGLALDLDGTLIDIDIRYVTDIFNRALNCFGRSAIQQEATVFWYGHRDRNEIIQEDYQINPTAFFHHFNSLDTTASRMANTYIYGCARRLLQAVRGTSLKLAVLTASLPRNAHMAINRIGITLINHVITTHEEGVSHKPDPSGLYECLRRMQIEKEELLWVGNGWEDLEAGRNAGVDTRIVYRKHQGFLPPEVVRIDSLDDIKELLGLQ